MFSGSPAALRHLGIEAADGAAVTLRRPCDLANGATTSAQEASVANVAEPSACPGAESSSSRADKKKEKKKESAGKPEQIPAKKTTSAPQAERADASLQVADSPPSRLPAWTKLPNGDATTFSVMTYNVLLPNSKDGWWIYKYYRDSDAEMTSWPARQSLLKQQTLDVAADFVCLQEVSDLSFAEDFAFLAEAGYESVMFSKGRMRPATFWRSERWESVAQLHKDRTLIVALKLKTGSHKGSVVFLINCHLSAGPAADRRMRQAHEALTTAAKEAQKMKLDISKCPVVFCGDLNSMGETGVRQLLVAGEVGPEFREFGDPTERGQQGKQLTAKVKSQPVGRFADVAELCFGKENVPATIMATNIDSKMQHENGEPTQEVIAAVKTAFKKLCSTNDAEMNRGDVDRWLLAVNKEVGRGSEYRAAMAAMEKRGSETLSEEDFVGIYAAELAEGKFWGVEHDLRVMLGDGMAIPSEGPCELCFDHIFFSVGTLRLVAVQESLSEEQRKRIWGQPYDVLPNSWHPSDHLPVAAVFALR